MVSRRKFVMQSALALAGTAVVSTAAQGQSEPASDTPPIGQKNHNQPEEPAVQYTPVVSPNVSKLSWKVVDGVKVFHLIAEPIRREFAPGLEVECWGYNGESPGPVIEVVEGDRCRFYITNNLQEPTSLHWHGALLPNGMDGVAGLTQPYIKPGETGKYEFTFRQHGTLMYHPHWDEMVQMGMGMMGMLIVHPRIPKAPKIDRDFVLMLSEWFIRPGTTRPDPTVMNEFNILTINSKVFPGTAPLVVKAGDRVRIRIGNLGATDHHPIHIHGHQFKVVGTDGGAIPEAAQWPETTILVPVGTTRDIEFIANAPGDWPLHCHMSHHVMNQMGHGLPNMLGVNTSGLDNKVRKVLPSYMTMGETGMGEMAEMPMGAPKNSIPMQGASGPFGVIDMGGMFTILKVREGINSYEDPGWYRHPTGTVSMSVSDEELRRDLGDAVLQKKKISGKSTRSAPSPDRQKH